MFLLFLYVLWQCLSINAFIAYDCSGLNMNITSISLIHNKVCHSTLPTDHPISVNIQLIQKSEIKLVETFQCLIKVHRTIHYCGMHSHLSAVQNGIATLINDVGEQNCRSIFKTKSFSLTNTKTISNLIINATTLRPITLIGKINVDGTCQGDSYTDFYGSWEQVVVQAEVSITLKHNYDLYNYKDNTIILKSGLQCNYIDGYCFDNEYGDTYWNFLTFNQCSDDFINVLYEGESTKLLLPNEQNKTFPLSSYYVEHQGNLFALRTIQKLNMCGFIIYQTEHPKLLIIEDQGQGFYFHQHTIHPLNLDLFTYINAKFVYIEKHLKLQILSLHRDSILQRCKLENQIINSHLSLAFISPNDFAYMYMKSSGYTAQVMGEVIHIIKCQPVDVILRPVDKCYLELPVMVSNQSYFMTPRSHLLIKYGTEISCNELLASYYFISNTWYSFSPTKHIMIPPHDFGSVIEEQWKYIDIKHLATDGIYTQDELSQLRDHIMYPVEKHSIENIMVRSYMGLHPEYQSQKGSFLLTPYDMDSLTENISKKIWTYITNFGNISSGIFGLYMIYLIMKHILALVFNSISLYKTLGCGLHLLGSICTSLTHLILNINQKEKPTKVLNVEDNQEEEKIIINTSNLYPILPTEPDPKFM